jgi:hypothetical protein
MLREFSEEECAEVEGKWMDNPGVMHANEPPEVSLQVTGCEEVKRRTSDK